MYQLVVTVREDGRDYHVNALLSEVLPGGGVAPVGSRNTSMGWWEVEQLGDPLQLLMSALNVFAESELNSGRTIPS